MLVCDTCKYALKVEEQQPVSHGISRLADDDALEYGHEILDVDEGVLASVHLKRLQGFHYQLPEVFPSLLAVVYSVSEVVWERRKRQSGSLGLSTHSLVSPY